MENPYEILLGKLKQELERVEDSVVYRILESLEKEKMRFDPLLEYVLAKDAANLLNVPPNALHRKKDEIGYIKCLGKIFFKVSDLVAYMEAGRSIKTEKRVMYTKGK
ncbi:helix-turn-helix domain-containing protein [Dyadobacter chenwenxiniae]|uniref:Helix-turn-helix domain-containing protein n=1 Tax=Dyadobacter chenwenxiniae TaxID=2906456 RepID=A0A9X1TCX0_9BACT|nr:helix-turn-helix domain-containing protein [Dyadobacter chenwenxiniae]MCF0060144.1 helix-turn-helix domain-containing protein [Dyadobacter chenwenxiniae]UON85881.1 helix-turn-helix domain-containing protein [Dyadobacter chenwenxiniae]